MLPKVVWVRFGLVKETGDSMFLPPAAYSQRRQTIMLNTDKRVRIKGGHLFFTLFHEFLHHINNVLNLPLFFDRLVDLMDELQYRDVAEWMREGKTGIAFLDG